MFASLGLVLFAVIVQGIAMTFVLHRAAAESAESAPAILLEAPSLILWSTLATLVLVGPLVLALTLSETHRYAGPIYRIEMYLKDICAKRDPGPLVLRKSDRLQDVAELLSSAMDSTIAPSESAKIPKLTEAVSGATPAGMNADPLPESRIA